MHRLDRGAIGRRLPLRPCAAQSRTRLRHEMRIYIYTYSLCGRRVKQLTQFQQRLSRIASDVQNTLDPPNTSSMRLALHARAAAPALRMP